MNNSFYNTSFRLAPFLPKELILNDIKSKGDQSTKDLYTMLKDQSWEFNSVWSEKEFSNLISKLDEIPKSEKIDFSNQFYEILSEAQFTSPFSELSLSLVYFSLRLFIDIKKRNLKKIYFLSREGQIFKTLFDSLLIRLGQQDFIETHYLVVSRRSTFVASLCSELSFDRLLSQYKTTSFSELFKSLNFSEIDIKKIRDHHQIHDLTKRYDDISQIDFFKNKLLNCSIFKEVLRETSVEQAKLFKEYLGDLNFSENETLAIVDVGWKGSIQDSIHKIYNSEINIIGFYLGMTSIGQQYYPKSKKYGVLFSVPEKTLYYQVYNEHRPLLEIYLGASHGSASSYIRNASGKVTPITDWMPEEKLLFQSEINPFQQKMLTVFDDLLNLILSSNLSKEQLEKNIAKIHFRMTISKALKRVPHFQKLTHYENFGIFEFANYHREGKYFTRTWLRNCYKMITNPRTEIYRDIWPALTFVNMRLSFMFPIYVFFMNFWVFHTNSIILKIVPRFTKKRIKILAKRILSNIKN